MDRTADDRARWLPDEGEMGLLIRRFDWSGTILGPISQWPQALRTSVSICLQSRFPLFVLWGPELILIYNDAYTPLLGAKHPALGRPMRVVWPDNWDVIGPVLCSVLAIGRATWMDDQLLVLNRHGNREDADFIYSYSPIRGDLGTIEGIFTAVVETTEKVLDFPRVEAGRVRGFYELTGAAARELVDPVNAQIEIGRAREQTVQALRGSEELLRIATRNANLFTWEIDVSTGRTSASENVTAIIGFPLPANLADAFEIIHPADREHVIREYEEAITLGRPFHSDQRLLNPRTGEIVHMRVDAALISDGAAGRSRLVGISRNVTEERLAEEALRISEERVRLATEAAEVYTWELDLQTGAIVTSANAERVRGSPPPHDDREGLAVVHPDDLVHVTERRAAAIRTGELLDIEYRIVDRETGAITWLRVQGNVVRDESGNPRRLVGVVQNVTAQKTVEEALRRSTEELEQRVQERTAELRCSAEALETLLEDRASLLRQLVRAGEEERQRIARELHDELGQPLTALQVGLGTLSTDAPEDLRRLIEIVVDLDRNVERLAFDLRPLALTELGLAAAIAHLVEKFRRESNVDVDLHVEIERERLEGAVETTLYRILQEALTNVWRHSGAASVSIIVDRRNDHLQMIVEDDGRGFDVDAVLHRRDGRRFGLLGIRERVSLVGGTLDIESDPGNGTTLYVRVPLERDGEA